MVTCHVDTDWAIHKISQENPRIIETVTKKLVVKENFVNYC